MRLHSRSGDRFNGMDLLYLATVGAKSGQRRTNPVTRFDDGDGWVVAASAGGMAQHPGWHHNVVAHPTDASATSTGRCGGGRPARRHARARGRDRG